MYLLIFTLVPYLPLFVEKRIATHIHRSTNGCQKLQEIQLEMGSKAAKPQVCLDVRWGGVISILSWTAFNKGPLRRYASECLANCALNDDGSGYNDHVLAEEEYEYVVHLVNASLHLCNVPLCPPLALLLDVLEPRFPFCACARCCL